MKIWLAKGNFFLLADSEGRLRSRISDLMSLVEDDALPDDGQELDGLRLVDLVRFRRSHVVQLHFLGLGEHAFHFGHDCAVGRDDEIELGETKKEQLVKFIQ